MEKRYQIQEQTGFFTVKNESGPVLGMGKLSVKEQEGLAFKNLSGQETLLPYEDWRLSAEVRASDLANRLSIEEIAGLMLWSPHQMVPFLPGMPFKGHYNGGAFVPGVTDPAELTDEQKNFVENEQIRNILLVGTESAEVSARWNNHLQILAEDIGIAYLQEAAEENFHALGMDFRGTVLVIGLDGERLADVPKMDMLLWALFRVVRYGRADRKNNVWSCRHCGHLEQFEADGPFENGWNICPVCGGWIFKPTD